MLPRAYVRHTPASVRSFTDAAFSLKTDVELPLELSVEPAAERQHPGLAHVPPSGALSSAAELGAVVPPTEALTSSEASPPDSDERVADITAPTSAVPHDQLVAPAESSLHESAGDATESLGHPPLEPSPADAVELEASVDAILEEAALDITAAAVPDESAEPAVGVDENVRLPVEAEGLEATDVVGTIDVLEVVDVLGVVEVESVQDAPVQGEDLESGHTSSVINVASDAEPSVTTDVVDGDELATGSTTPIPEGSVPRETLAASDSLDETLDETLDHPQEVSAAKSSRNLSEPTAPSLEPEFNDASEPDQQQPSDLRDSSSQASHGVAERSARDTERHGHFGSNVPAAEFPPASLPPITEDVLDRVRRQAQGSSRIIAREVPPPRDPLHAGSILFILAAVVLVLALLVAIAVIFRRAPTAPW